MSTVIWLVDHYINRWLMNISLRKVWSYQKGDVIQKMTDNTIVKRKGQSDNDLHKKLYIKQHEHHLKLMVSTGGPEG